MMKIQFGKLAYRYKNTTINITCDLYILMGYRDYIPVIWLK